MSRHQLIEKSQQIKNETNKFANTALRVGGLLEDISEDARLLSDKVNARALYNNVDEPYVLVTNTPKRIQKEGGLFALAQAEGVTLVNDRLVASREGRMLISGMISFQGYNGGQYKLQLRKNDEIVCICNPLVQTQATRVTNLTSTDYTEFQEGDTLSLWVVDQGSGGTIQLKTAKIVLINI
jgi:hypothetical protein